MAYANKEIHDSIGKKISWGSIENTEDGKLTPSEVEYYLSHLSEFEGTGWDWHDSIQEHMNERVLNWATTGQGSAADVSVYVTYWKARQGWSEDLKNEAEMSEEDEKTVSQAVEGRTGETGSLFTRGYATSNNANHPSPQTFVAGVESIISPKVLAWSTSPSDSQLLTDSGLAGAVAYAMTVGGADDALGTMGGILWQDKSVLQIMGMASLMAIPGLGIANVVGNTTEAILSRFQEWKAVNAAQYEELFVGKGEVKVPGHVTGFDFNPEAEDPINIKNLLTPHYDEYVNEVEYLEDEQVGDNPESKIFEKHIEAAADELAPKAAIIMVNEYRTFLAIQVISREDYTAPLDKDDFAAAAGEANEEIAGLGEPSEADAQLTAEDIEKRQRFFKQCALLLRMKDLSQQYRDYIQDQCYALETDSKKSPDNAVHYGGKPFGGRFWMIGDSGNDNSATISRLFATKQMDPFLNMTPDIISLLVPKIRLYKVFVAEHGGLEEVEFEFEQKTDPRGFFDGTTVDKGNGAGIKQFSFEFVGSNPATAKNDIKAKLSLYFQSFQDFFTCRKSSSSILSNGASRYYKYVDMILYPGAHDCEENLISDEAENLHRAGAGAISRFQYDSTYYRIRADVGWVIPESDQAKAILNKRGSGYADGLIKALKMTNKNFFLNMVDHSIDIKQDGTVTIDIDYRAYIETALKSNRFDALVDRQRAADRISREQQMKEASRMGCTPTQMVELQKAFELQDTDAIKKGQQSIHKRLVERNKLFYIDLDESSADEFRSQGFFSSEPVFAPLAEEGQTVSAADAAGLQEASEAGADGNTGGSYSIISNVFKDRDVTKDVRINYFFLGDLVHLVLDSCFHESDNTPLIENTKIILSSLDLLDFYGNPYSINIAEIPISKEFFDGWYVENVVKQERINYSVLAFIKELCNELIVSTLTDICVNKDLVKKMFFDTAVLSGVGDNGSDPFSKMVSASNILVDTKAQFDAGKLPLIADQGIETVSISEFFNYMLLYASYNSLKTVGEGREEDDLNRGVYHMHIGARAGLVKNIKFSKTDMQFIRESRFMNQGTDGLLQLGAVYKATIEMVGNTIFYPGMEIFINTMGLGGAQWDPTQGVLNGGEASIANKLGLGGYHLVTRVNNTISSGKFNTTVEAQWHYAGDGTTPRMESKNKKSENESIEDIVPDDPNCSKYIAVVQSAVADVAAGRATSTEEAIESATEAQDQSRAAGTTYESVQAAEDVEAAVAITEDTARSQRGIQAGENVEEMSAWEILKAINEAASGY